MNHDAELAYKEALRTIEEEKECNIRIAQASALLQREEVTKAYLQAQRASWLKEMTKSSRKVRSPRHEQEAHLPQGGNQTVVVNLTNNTAPQFHQNGDGGQYVAEKMYSASASSLQTISSASS